MKNKLRKEIKGKLSLMTIEERIRESNIILNKLENNEFFIKSNDILIYWSIDNEVITHDFIDKWYQKKNLYLPVIVDNE